MRHIAASIAFLLILTGFQVNADNIPGPDHEGDQAFLGINFERISREKAEVLHFDNPYGSYITGIIPNTAAEKAGLQPFDYVFGIDEHRTGRSTALGDILSKYRTGDEATVHYYRKGEARQARITFLDLSRTTGALWVESGERPFLGINRHADNDDEALGVRIYVIDNSTAREMGLRDGDVITAINGYPMVDWTDITTAVNMIKPEESVRVDFLRDGRKEQASAPIKRYRETRQLKGTSSEWKPQEKAFLGIQSTDISTEKAQKLGIDNAYGSYVTKVLGNTAAEKAGLQPLDYIYGVDEYRTGEGQRLSAILQKFEAGDQASVHLVRQEKKQTVAVTFGSRADVHRETMSECDDPFLGVRQVSKQDEKGIPVEIVDNSTAEAIGLEDGDIITHINGWRMLDWQDIGIAVDNTKVGETITVDFLRNGTRQTKSGPVKSICDTKKDRSAWNFDFDFDFDFDREKGEAPRWDLAAARVETGTVSAQEAQKMKTENKVELPMTNDLRVEQLQLYPNPDKGMFRLQFELPQRGETSIRLYNAAGRLIYNYDLGSYQGDFSDNVDIAQNGAGDYFLVIRQGNQSLTRKITLKM